MKTNTKSKTTINSIKPLKSILVTSLILAFGVACQSTDKQSSVKYPIAYSSKISGDGEIYLTGLDKQSKVNITNREGNDGYPTWSPDGKKLAFYSYHDGRKTWSIHTMNSDGTNNKRLTFDKNKWDSSPSWSPDGEKIVFGRGYKDLDKVWREEVWVMNADGSEQTQISTVDGGGPSFLPDGRIIFHSKSGYSNIFITDIKGENIVQLTDNEAEDWHPEISPDGKQVAFMSKRDGNLEIYTMNIDGTEQKRITNNDIRDSTPIWSSDGSKILFVSKNKEGKSHIYQMNTDGSSKAIFIEGGTQPAIYKG